jgi:hypothetical protein
MVGLAQGDERRIDRAAGQVATVAAGAYAGPGPQRLVLRTCTVAAVCCRAATVHDTQPGVQPSRGLQPESRGISSAAASRATRALPGRC